MKSVERTLRNFRPTYWFSAEWDFLYTESAQSEVMTKSDKKVKNIEWLDEVEDKKLLARTLSLLGKNLMPPVDLNFFGFRVEQLCPEHTAGLPLGGPS